MPQAASVGEREPQTPGHGVRRSQAVKLLLWGLPLCSRDTTRATLPTSTEDARAITMAGGSWCNVGARNAASCCNCLAVSKTTSFNCRVALWMTCDHVYADRDSEFVE